jgi:hypothetical protein
VVIGLGGAFRCALSKQDKATTFVALKFDGIAFAKAEKFDKHPPTLWQWRAAAAFGT